MSSNGRQHPRRPQIEIRQAAASPAEAAAIAAAIEQFLRDTAPPSEAADTALSPWLKAGLLEGTGRDPGEESPGAAFVSNREPPRTRLRTTVGVTCLRSTEPAGREGAVAPSAEPPMAAARR